MKITEKELKDFIKEVILESHTKAQEKELEEIVGELENASKMHKSQAERIQKILDDTDDKELKEGDELEDQRTNTEEYITRFEKEYKSHMRNKQSDQAATARRELVKLAMDPRIKNYNMKKLRSFMRSMKKGKEPVTENLNCGCGNDPCITFGVVSIKEARKIVREEIQADLEEEKKTDKERMKCNSPRRIRKGEAGHGTKKFVVKACKDGKEKIIRYGDAKMEIKKDSPERRKSFRARHGCDTKKGKDKMSARYWSCKKW